MSWKSFLTAGLLCVLATPVFAAPAVSRVGGGANSSGLLDANGDWVWNIQISNSDPIPTGASPLAAELGFKASNTLVGATNLSTGAGNNFDTVNPGKAIWGWELPGTGTNNNPEGIQTNCATGCTVNVAGNNPNSVFAALGSADFNTVGPHPFIQVKTKGPSTGTGGSLTTTLTLSGAYTGKGRIAEASAGTPPSVNHDLYGGAITLTAKAGDINLDGTISNADYSTLIGQYNQNPGTRKWFHGDFNGDGSVTNADYSALIGNYGPANNYTVITGGFTAAGAGSGLDTASVPEPSTIALIGLAALSGIGIRRKR